MSIKFPFRHLEPFFCSGLFDDPVLIVRIAPSKRMLMFDCGQVHHLAKHIFTHLDAIFISHAHMDHWMGIDSVIRHLIVADRTLHVYGPVGLADKMEAKLNGYDWNLCEPYWCNCEVHEISETTLTSNLFIGGEGFKRSTAQSKARTNHIVYSDHHCQVKAEICSHDLPSVVYRVEEKPPFIVDHKKLQHYGIEPGPWIANLQKAYFKNMDLFDRAAVETLNWYPQKTSERTGPCDFPPAELLVKQTPLALGYISDIACTSDNLERLRDFMFNVQLLISECTYLAEHYQRAQAAHHLCTTDINHILATLRPDYFLPMHLSKSYRKSPLKLYQEISPPTGTQIVTLPDFTTPEPLSAKDMLSHMRLANIE